MGCHTQNFTSSLKVLYDLLSLHRLYCICKRNGKYTASLNPFFRSLKKWLTAVYTHGQKHLPAYRYNG